MVTRHSNAPVAPDRGSKRTRRGLEDLVGEKRDPENHALVEEMSAWLEQRGRDKPFEGTREVDARVASVQGSTKSGVKGVNGEPADFSADEGGGSDEGAGIAETTER